MEERRDLNDKILTSHKPTQRSRLLARNNTLTSPACFHAKTCPTHSPPNCDTTMRLALQPRCSFTEHDVYAQGSKYVLILRRRTVNLRRAGLEMQELREAQELAERTLSLHPSLSHTNSLSRSCSLSGSPSLSLSLAFVLSLSHSLSLHRCFFRCCSMSLLLCLSLSLCLAFLSLFLSLSFSLSLSLSLSRVGWALTSRIGGGNWQGRAWCEQVDAGLALSLSLVASLSHTHTHTRPVSCCRCLCRGLCLVLLVRVKWACMRSFGGS